MCRSSDWKLDLKTRMVQKLIYKKLREVCGHIMSSPCGWSDLGTFLVAFPDGDTVVCVRAEFMIEIFDFKIV